MDRWIDQGDARDTCRPSDCNIKIRATERRQQRLISATAGSTPPPPYTLALHASNYAVFLTGTLTNLLAAQGKTKITSRAPSRRSRAECYSVA